MQLFHVDIAADEIYDRHDNDQQEKYRNCINQHMAEKILPGFGESSVMEQILDQFPQPAMFMTQMGSVIHNENRPFCCASISADLLYHICQVVQAVLR